MLETLNLPEVDPKTYPRNLIQKTVCELRFPTLYGMERGKPPVALANALRKAFPEHGIVDNLNVGFGGVAQDFAFVFSDKRQKTSVTFRPSALTVETTAYKSFEEFFERILFAAEAAKSIIDADFFTRIGLRYINQLPYHEGKMAEWVNPVLVAPLQAGVFESPVEYNGRISSNENGEGFLLQHGITKRANEKVEYLLDFDLWQEDVDFSNLSESVKSLHGTGLRLFHWSLGQEAFNFMGSGVRKK